MGVGWDKVDIVWGLIGGKGLRALVGMGGCQ